MAGAVAMRRRVANVGMVWSPSSALCRLTIADQCTGNVQLPSSRVGSSLSSVLRRGMQSCRRDREAAASTTARLSHRVEAKAAPIAAEVTAEVTAEITAARATDFR